MRTRIMLVPMLAAVFATAACGGYGGSTKTSTGSEGAKSVSGMSSIEVVQDDFNFNPKVLGGTAGQKITVELKNEGKVEHNFSIPSEGVDQTVPPGKTASVQVTFPKSGSVAFFCKFHKSQGMTGSLTVSGSSSGTGATTTGTSTGY